MQRWIVLGLVVMVIVFGSGSYGLWTYRQSRPMPIWVPLPLNAELPKERREDLVKQLKNELSQRTRLEKISSELNLAKEWSLPSADAATDALAKKVFVKLGAMETETQRLDALLIGVNVTRRDKDLGGKIAMRLKDDVWEILGLNTPGKK